MHELSSSSAVAEQRGERSLNSSGERERPAAPASPPCADNATAASPDVVATNGTAAALDAPCPPNETAKAAEAAWTPSELRVSGSDVMESRPRPETPMQRAASK